MKNITVLIFLFSILVGAIIGHVLQTVTRGFEVEDSFYQYGMVFFIFVNLPLAVVSSLVGVIVAEKIWTADIGIKVLYSMGLAAVAAYILYKLVAGNSGDAWEITLPVSIIPVLLYWSTLTLVSRVLGNSKRGDVNA